MSDKKKKKTCRNCEVLRQLHKIGRDCNWRWDRGLMYIGACQYWINGKCRNNLNVKIES